MRVDLTFLPAYAAAFMLVFARIGAMVMLLPTLGEANIPARIKLGIALLLTMIILPLHRAAGIVAERFRGRLIAARLVPPRPDERARGVVLVHRLRLLTPARDVLEIRLDARSGAFLEVAGAGLTRARRTGDRE